MDGLRIRWALVSGLVTLACGPQPDSTSTEAGSSSTSSSGGGDGSTSTSTTAPQTTGSDGVDTSGSSGPGSPDCSDYMGRATPEQTAMTPLESAEAELLAIEASGEIVAPPALHDRIVTELAAIRREQPGLAGIVAAPDWWPSSILVTLETEGLEAYDAGTYHGWDCPNELYHVTELDQSGLFGAFIVRFEGLYDVRQVVEDYRAAELVQHAELDVIGGDSSDVCLSIAGDVHTYIFDDARGDCPAGCTEHVFTGLTVDLDGTITALGSFDPTDPMPAPAWYDAAESCTMWL